MRPTPLHRSSRRSVASILTLAILASLGAGSASVPARADVFEMADGSKVEGKVIQEKDGFVWIRTLVETKKVAAADIKTKTAGPAPADVMADLDAKIAKDPRDVKSLWALYELLTAHAAESKEIALKAKPIPARIIKIDPDHEEAHDALGETRFDGKWVKKEDVPRLEAELERRKKKEAFQKQYQATFDLYDGDHWQLVDNTGCKDLARKAKELDDAYRILGEALGADRFWDGQATVVTLKKFGDYARILDESWKSWGISQWRYDAARLPTNCGIWLHRPTPFQMRCPPDQKADGEDGMWAAVIHNSVHVQIWSMRRASEPPAWFEEGLASVIELEVRGVQKAYCVGVAGVDKGGTTDKPAGKRGNGNKDLAGESQVFKEHAKKAVEDDQFPEMRKFLRMKTGDFGPAEVGGAIGLVTWLRGKDPEKFKALWAEIRQGPKKDDDPWKKVYGYNVIEDMEKEWKIWVRTEW
ncbi:MAG: hypothetical protein K8T90_11130 [Planctomycetes bacterium]|nr:hypothetical protein [Planctomycetota bacterium]